MKKYLPDYEDGSIVNLMSSVFSAIGNKKSKYKYNPLKILNPKELKNKNIVLLILDGLGYEYLKKNGKNTFLLENTKGKMTSVYPPTTASAITSFATGRAPSEHAVLGWDVFLKEIGLYCPIFMFNEKPYADRGINFKKIIKKDKIFHNVKAERYVIQPVEYDSEYNRIFFNEYRAVGYKNLDGLFKKLKSTIKKSKRRKYVYSYWPMIDGYAHRHGVKSKIAKNHFKEVDVKIQKLAKSLKGTDTVLIITADHGLTDIDKTIRLDEYPEFMNTLVMPPTGDSRVGYYNVKLGKEKEFRRLFSKYFSKHAELYKAKDLIKKNYFGFYPSEKFIENLRDYVIISKGANRIKHIAPGEKGKKFKAHHSGLSKEEMFVPLIVVKIK